jgi:hypothetical protein
VAPSEAADLALHAALLVGAVDAGAAEEQVETVMAAQCGEPFGLRPVTALEDPDDGGFEVVVPDPSGNTAEVLEGQYVALFYPYGKTLRADDRRTRLEMSEPRTAMPRG